MVLWAAAAAWMMLGVRADLARTLDGRLAMSARMVSGLLAGSAIDPNAKPTDFTQAVRVNGSEGIACEIRALRGEVLARTSGSPASDFNSLPAGYSTRMIAGHEWRIYVLRDDSYQITTADRVEQRNTLVNELLFAAGVPFLIALLGGLAALWIGIGHGLAPLQALRMQLRAKQTDDTTPITVAKPPTELRPVLDAMNGLLGRLSLALSGQRAFTDAAAHELRTPLTVIDTHLQVARLTEGEEAESSLCSAEEGVRRLRGTLEQMMVLARAEASTNLEDRSTSIREVIASVIDAATVEAQLRLAVSVHGTDACCSIPREMLEAAIRNLMDNAIRYSPEDMPVEILARFDSATRQCRIVVADRGPGLSEDQAAKIGQRFWRGDQGRSRNDGAGLGISIVHAIAQRFGGMLNLKPRAGGGLVAELVLPCCPLVR